MVILIGNRLSCEVANDLGYASQPFPLQYYSVFAEQGNFFDFLT